MSGAIVIGGYVNALGVVRALAARGLAVDVVSTRPFDIAQHSRWCGRHHTVPNLHECPDGLATLLLERLARERRGWALVPVNDEAIAALALHREALEKVYRIVAPHPDAARYLLDKRLMMRAAQEVGVAVPEVYAGPAAVRFPVVVKPLVSYRFAARFGTKLGVARDRAELDRWLAAAADIPCVLMDLVPGADDALHVAALFLDEDGAPVAGRTVRKLRQGPPGFGDARVAEVVAPDTELHDAAIAIARRIGLCGIAVAEFKRDARDGRFRFLEINGRSVVYNELLRGAGLDLPALAVGEGPGANGGAARWVHLHPDLLYSLRDRIGRERFMAPYRGPWKEAVWSRRDPAPFLAQWARMPRRGTSPSGAPAPRDG
jgi:predicted ATP-grasp superfamily ATP-dependent carboligase